MGFHPRRPRLTRRERPWIVSSRQRGKEWQNGKNGPHVVVTEKLLGRRRRIGQDEDFWEAGTPRRRDHDVRRFPPVGRAALSRPGSPGRRTLTGRAGER